MKRSFAIGSGLAIAALVVIIFLCRGRQIGSGDIKRARMTESHPPTRIETIVSKAREVLHLASVDTRQRNYLRIGTAQMEWSLMGTSTKTGWLYFSKPESNDPLWEFAPCSHSKLTSVRPVDLDAEFVHIGDTNKIQSAFDAGSWSQKATRQPLSGRVIPVHEGQIILARLIDSPRTVYAIRLIDQRGTDHWGSINVEYVEIDLQEAEPYSTANGSQPVRSETKSESSAAGSGR